MALVIYSNVGHLRAENALLRNARSLDTQLRKISSGLRVGSARDDAAGLAISERMETQVRGLGKAIQNARDGAALAQTVEGVYQETSNLLQRIRELTVQGLSGQLNQTDRIAIQEEIEQLKDELDHIGETEYNGRKLFGEDYLLHITDSAELDAVMQLSTQKLSSGHLGYHVMHTASSPVNPSAAFGDDTLQIITADGVEVSIRGTSAVDDQVSFYNPEGSAIAKAAAINATTSLHGVTAIVAPTVSVGIQVKEVSLDEGNYLRINDVTITGFKVEESDADGVLLKAINAEFDETGVLASIDGDGRLILTAEDGRNVVVETYGDAYLAGLNSGTTGGQLTFTSAETFTLRFKDQATNEALGSLVPEIPTQQTYVIADGSRSITPGAGAYTAGPSGIDLTKFTLEGVGVGQVNSIRPSEGQDLNLKSTGDILVFDSADPSQPSGILPSGEARAIVFNDTIAAGETTTIELNVLALNNDISEFYARGIHTSLGFDLEAAESNGSGRANEDLLLQYSLDGGSTWLTHSTLVDRHKVRGTFPPALLPAVDPNGGTDQDRLEAARIQRSVTFSQDYMLRIAQENYTGEEFDHYALVYGAIKTTAVSSSAEAIIGKSFEHSVESIYLLDEEGRRSALYVIDQALAEVSEAQVTLGGIQNRLEATINDLEVTRTSTLQSQSRIRDADFAMEVAELSRAQIIQRATAEVLSSLTQQPGIILQLLRG